jgi:RsiW-degrading membrane proteinase PrsW (M82 family)
MLLLTKIRLTHYYLFFFALFALLSFVVPKSEFTSSQMTLFTVNSFLYGFYLAPILTAQKARVEELIKVVRAEATALFGIRLKSKQLSEKERAEIKQLELMYLHARNHRLTETSGEKEYEAMVSWCLDYKGKNHDKVAGILDNLVMNEQNRTNFAMHIGNKVFSHEWVVMLILFSITIAFVLLFNSGNSLLLKFVAALLCTGLSMLLVIVAKLTTLTHKRAKHILDPFKKLADSNFRRMD